MIPAKIKVMFILKNLTDEFYNGGGVLDLTGLLNMADREKFNYLSRMRHHLAITMRIGNGTFREQVELNAMLRLQPAVGFSLQPRRGYKLASLDFSCA